LSLLLVCACTSRSCGGCGDEGLAVLVEWKGRVQRDRAARTGQFTTAGRGARFDSGDGLRTLASAQARLQLRGASYVLVQSDTTIRLWRGGKRGLKLKVQTGDASVVAVQTALEIDTEFGVAILQAGGQLRVKSTPYGQRYEVTMGRAMLIDRDGQQVTLEPGDGLGTGAPHEMEGMEAMQGVAAAPAPLVPDAGAARASLVADAGAVRASVVADAGAPNQVSARALPQAARGPSDMTLALGSSVAIYDPKPPSAVSIDAQAVCPSGALLSLRGRAPVRVVDHETLLFSAGAHDYKLVCLGEHGQPGPIQLRGTLHVVRNPGTMQLPRSAPKNSIDTDGRTYTIMFQNLLPMLEVRWPHAPEAKGYSLSVELGSGRELQVASSKPMHVFSAGALPEGRHKLRFTADRVGSPRSKQTTVELRFDNAAPSASLRAPNVAGFEPGPSVHVAGIALPGSQVSVLGQRLTLDAQQRFAGDVSVPPGTRSIAVRIQHPRSGTRYYIRRVRSSP
jgi:hypothetical protein